MNDVPEPSLAEKALRWIAQDPDPETQEELRKIVEAGDKDELASRMDRPLEFGTAGLRGVIGAGLARMNRAVVIRTTSGVADYLLDRVVDSRTLPVVVGYDARLHSRRFAEDVVGVLVAAGIHVRYFRDPVPTPLVAYCARQLGAMMAIVVTASHNPPEYNGYKVYSGNAIQLNSPADQDIAARIARAGSAKDVPRQPRATAGGSPLAEPISSEMFQRYLAEVDVYRPGLGLSRDLKVVYTPLHGVGGRYVTDAFARAGYPSLHVVAEQAEPDGNFPTVRFPNPEEPGTLDLAQALARQVDADLVIANDPDADRLSVCVPTPSGRWVQLTGNQVGLLLADFLLALAARRPTPLVISSVVSSPMLDSIAAVHGARVERTLTGFKWICSAGLTLERQGGCRFVFGYEEAHGYAIPVVRDKDGISAGLLFADLASSCRASGQTVRERLDELYRQHGLWVSHPVTVTCAGSEGRTRIAAAMEKLRRRPPECMADLAVQEVVDFAVGAEDRAPWLPATSLVELVLAGGSRVFVRPSGTEPKLKIYIEICVELLRKQVVCEREAQAHETAKRVSQEVAEYLGLI